MNLKEFRKSINDLWELARAGNELALKNILEFITLDGRTHLVKYIRRRRAVRSGLTTEVLQRTAIRIHEHASSGKLPRPKDEPYFTLGGYVRYITREVIRSDKVVNSARYPNRIGLTDVEDYLGKIHDGFQPARDIPEMEDHLRDLDLLNEGIAELPPKERKVMRARLDGMSNAEISQVTGESNDLVRQRFHRGVEHLAKLLKMRRKV
jgi:RNA polymerase sigma factor (sigma-70 family)